MTVKRQGAMKNKCTVCGRAEVTVFMDIHNAPVLCNAAAENPEQAYNARRADIRLGFCSDCGHIFNTDFAPETVKYQIGYENSLHFSQRFQRYAENLAEYLISGYDLHKKNIIEIGCGRGADFLKLLCRLGANQGLGFDPGYAGAAAVNVGNGRVDFVKDFYSSAYRDQQADFICCQHVLEHVLYPGEIVSSCNHTDKRHKRFVFFEVPNAEFIFRDLSVWDLIYEHCSYFSVASLRYLFEICGFTVLNCRTSFDSQFLSIEAASETNSRNNPADNADDVMRTAEYVADFSEKYKKIVSRWKRKLKSILSNGRRAVLWGAGSKGVSFLNTVAGPEQIQYVVDINPFKQGKYIPGTAQKIVAPEFLRTCQPDVVIVTNPIYKDEIVGTLDSLTLTAELITC